MRVFAWVHEYVTFDCPALVISFFFFMYAWWFFIHTRPIRPGSKNAYSIRMRPSASLSSRMCWCVDRTENHHAISLCSLSYGCEEGHDP